MTRRIQMTRKPGGWRADHPEAVIVARPTRWGNLYRVVQVNQGLWMVVDGSGEDCSMHQSKSFAAAAAVDEFYDSVMVRGIPVTVDEIRAELSGRDLACWCPRGQACHADVLIELANEPEPELIEVVCDYCKSVSEDTLDALQAWGWRCGEDSDDTCCPDCMDMVRAECVCGVTETGPGVDLVQAGWSPEGCDVCPGCRACTRHSWQLTGDPDVLACVDCPQIRRYRPIGVAS